MDYVTSDDGEPMFSKTFQVEPQSKIQYKFRVGEGDWWVLDDDAATGRCMIRTLNHSGVSDDIDT